MSQTIDWQLPTPTVTATFNEYAYYSIAHQVQEDFVVVGILGGLYGMGSLYASEFLIRCTEICDQGYSPFCLCYRYTPLYSASNLLLSCFRDN